MSGVVEERALSETKTPSTPPLETPETSPEPVMPSKANTPQLVVSATTRPPSTSPGVNSSQLVSPPQSATTEKSHNRTDSSSSAVSILQSLRTASPDRALANPSLGVVESCKQEANSESQPHSISSQPAALQQQNQYQQEQHHQIPPKHQQLQQHQQHLPAAHLPPPPCLYNEAKSVSEPFVVKSEGQQHMPMVIPTPGPLMGYSPPLVHAGPGDVLQRCLDELAFASSAIQQLLAGLSSSPVPSPQARSHAAHIAQRLRGVSAGLDEWSREGPPHLGAAPAAPSPYPIYIPMMGMQFPTSSGVQGATPGSLPINRSTMRPQAFPASSPQVSPSAVPSMAGFPNPQMIAPSSYSFDSQLLAPLANQALPPVPPTILAPGSHAPESAVLAHAHKKTRKRQRLDTTNVQCQQCGTQETPEWRRGPDGARTLCNACGLYHAKVAKKKGEVEAAKRLRERRPIRYEELREVSMAATENVSPVDTAVTTPVAAST